MRKQCYDNGTTAPKKQLTKKGSARALYILVLFRGPPACAKQQRKITKFCVTWRT